MSSVAEYISSRDAIQESCFDQFHTEIIFFLNTTEKEVCRSCTKSLPTKLANVRIQLRRIPLMFTNHRYASMALFF